MVNRHLTNGSVRNPKDRSARKKREKKRSERETKQQRETDSKKDNENSKKDETQRDVRNGTFWKRHVLERVQVSKQKNYITINCLCFIFFWQFFIIFIDSKKQTIKITKLSNQTMTKLILLAFKSFFFAVSFIMNRSHNNL